jgi:ABC-type polysaccharide/polyol phosphate export permease
MSITTDQRRSAAPEPELVDPRRRTPGRFNRLGRLGVVTAVNQLWSFRFLIWNLAQRDLRSRYKKSVLGWLWSMINPAMNLAVLSIVFGVFFGSKPPQVAANGSTDSFALYLFAGLVVWNFFSATVNGSIGALQASGGMLNKVYFPPVCPAIANMITVMLQTVIEFSILAFAMIVVRNADWHILFVPFLILLLGVFSLGVGLLVSIFNVFYRDIGYIVAIAMNILFYATPIIYSIDLQVRPKLEGTSYSWLLWFFELNPLTQFVGWSRDLFWYQRFPGLGSIIGVTVVSFGMFFLGWWFFNRKAQTAAEEL